MSSILSYFSLRSKEGSLPNPTGSLSRKISPSAIVSANSEVAKVIQQVNNNGSILVPGKSSKRSKPRFFSPKERAEIGKLACSIGATAAARHFSKKLGYTMNKSMVRGLKQAYLTERRQKRLMEDEDLTVHELPMKKKGRPLLLGKKLDDAVQEYILKLREHGSAINTVIVVAVAKGLALAMDRTRLAEYGSH